MNCHPITGVAAVLLATAVARAETAPGSPDGIWQDAVQSLVANDVPQQWSGIRAYRLVRLEQVVLQSTLAKAPLETDTLVSTSPSVMTLPMPDGTFQRFQFVDSPVMAPELAAQYPDFKTYLGQGLDDPRATVRFDWTVQGFHAMVLSPSGTVFIDPYIKGQTDLYVSFYRRDVSREAAAWTCLTRDEPVIPEPMYTSGILPLSSGNQLRTYRVAFAATGEYTQQQGGLPQALAAITTIVNRISGVYELEFCIRLQLVANNNSIVYTNGATDPYTNGDHDEMLVENQENLDDIIGSANYDVGHILGTRGGNGASGVAYVGVICNNSWKAQGASSSSGATGDWFIMEIIVHEVGHQLGSSHSWNGTNGGCTADQWSSTTGCEPGSGSTIMGYPGSCGVDDLQYGSDEYFHAISYQKIRNYCTSGTGGNCAVLTNTGNGVPGVSVASAYTIPAQTPFILDSFASDPDGDYLTYCWEEMDLGPQAPLSDGDNGSSPIFRSWPPTDNTYRMFPRLTDLLNNTTTKGELLPTTNRTLLMRCTVRDNHAGAGGVATDDTTLTVAASAGPFRVTSPNTNVTWAGTKTVMWSVANTNVAPVSCSNVNIRLSTNGGLTFPTLLASNTPNDGVQSVSIPYTATNQARIKVEAVGNVFFDISDTNFSICSTPAPPTNISASDGTYDYIYLTWTLPSGEPFPLSHLEIWRNTTNNSATATRIEDHWTSSNYYDTTAAPNVTYYYWLKVVNTCGGTSGFSASDSGWHPIAPPATISASDGTASAGINVEWSSAGTTYYRLYRNTTNNPSFALPVTPWQTSTWYFDSATAVTPGVTHYYWVRAANASNGSDATEFSDPDTGWRKLLHTQDVIASNGVYTARVYVGWSSVWGATHYRVYRHNTNAPDLATAISGWQTSIGFDDVTATPGTTYFYWVKAAIDATGYRPNDLVESDPGWRELSPPTGVTATDGTDDTQILVTWTAATGATHYRLYRNSINDPVTATIQGGWQTDTSYSDYTAYGVDFYYWVQCATDTSGYRASDLSIGDVGWRALPPPEDVSATDGEFTGRVRVTWDPGPSSSWFYRVYRGNSTNPKLSSPLSSWMQDATLYDDTDASPGVTYYYWLKAALDEEGTRASSLSSANPGWRALIGPAVSASDDAYVDRVEVTWQAVPGASHYRVYRGTVSNPDAASPVSAWRTATSFADTSAQAGRRYYYWAKAAIDLAGTHASEFGRSDRGSRAADCNDNGVPDPEDPDRDSDGVPDDCDNCPNTVPNAPVDEYGCPALIPPDFDRDGDVDITDLEYFVGCARGPAIPITLHSCGNADFDDDQDVDQGDFSLLQRCWSGTGNPAYPSCLD